MEFRPCIDIHDGKVKQIVGGSLSDNNGASENFVSSQDAAFFAKFYMERKIKGGHVILLNKSGTPEYELTKNQAFGALMAYPGGLQIGGGITADNAKEFIDNGASHVIVTSYVFREGRIDYERLEKLVGVVGKNHLVLDLSCRKKGDAYYIVTDRWQNFTDQVVDVSLLLQLEKYCDEYLIHAVDVEGKRAGVDNQLISIMGDYLKTGNNKITYAGGVSSYKDLQIVKENGCDNVNVTIGSALDLFGGDMVFDEVLAYINNQ